MKFLHLNFLPRSADVALLALRLWFGLSMLLLHGLDKVQKFQLYTGKFADPLGIMSPKVGLSAVIFAELVCAGLLALGMFTRIAALVLGFTMFVAYWFAHKHDLSPAGGGEMAFVYLGACVALFIGGAGKYSVDAKIGAKG